MKRNKEEEICPWEADYELLVCEGLFSEYLEMGESLTDGPGLLVGQG